MAKIIGGRRHRQKLQSLTRRSARAAGQAIFAGASILETEARRLIVAGAVQGAGHVPSAPGEPPNRDTSQLDTSITAQKTGALTSEVRVGAPYGAALEFGTVKMAERPYMRPATATSRPKIEALVARAVRRALRRSF